MSVTKFRYRNEKVAPEGAWGYFVAIGLAVAYVRTVFKTKLTHFIFFIDTIFRYYFRVALRAHSIRLD